MTPGRILQLRPNFPLVLTLICGLSVFLSACGPTYTRTVMLEGRQLDPGKDGILVGSITLETDTSTVGAQEENVNRNDITPEELYQAYREYLEQSLAKNGIAYAPGKNKFVTNISILGYKEGNAFVRWLTPAGGESKVTVQATLESEDLVIGGVESQQTVAWGGAFSIGGWRHVINWSADKIAQQLCHEVFDHSTGKPSCTGSSTGDAARYEPKAEIQK